MRYTRPAAYRSLAVPLLLLSFLLGALTFLVQRDPSHKAEAANGCATASFAGAVPFATGRAPQSVVMDDFNGDGRLDLAVTNSSDAAVSVLLNTTLAGAPNPSFSSQQRFPSGGSGPVVLASGDVNSDGKPDLAVTNTSDGTVSVLLNTTSAGAPVASFSSATLATQFVFAQPMGSLAFGEFNGDGRPDLAVTIGFLDLSFEGISLPGPANVVVVLLNTTPPGSATPSFAAMQTFAVPINPFGIATADFNGDGRLDLAVANNLFLSTRPGSVRVGTVSVLLNTTAAGAPTASFAARQTFQVGVAGVSDLVQGDLNGDGRPDLAVVHDVDGTVSVLLNTTGAGALTPSFTPQQTFPAGDGAVRLAMGDLNGDGRPDLAVTNVALSGKVSVLLNTTLPGAGMPSLAAPQQFPAGTGPRDVAIGDVNGDGRQDLAAINFDNNTVSVLLNTCTSLPTVATTSPATNITNSTATVSGNVTSDGGALLSSRGIVLAQASVNPSPALGGTGAVVLIDAASVLGAFSENAAGLSEGTTYAFRAFASNSAGTGYGSAVIFTTAAPGTLTPTPTLLLPQRPPVIPQGLQNPQALAVVQAGNRATPAPARQTFAPTEVDPGRIAIQPPRTGDGGLRGSLLKGYARPG